MNCHLERSQAKSEAIGLAESKDPYPRHSFSGNRRPSRRLGMTRSEVFDRPPRRQLGFRSDLNADQLSFCMSFAYFPNPF
jgi:hypothetical protein